MGVNHENTSKNGILGLLGRQGQRKGNAHSTAQICQIGRKEYATFQYNNLFSIRIENILLALFQLQP